VNEVKLYLIITFTEKLELLSFLVHEHAVKVTRLNSTYLDGFVAPAHYLTSAYVCYRQHHQST